MRHQPPLRWWQRLLRTLWPLWTMALTAPEHTPTPKRERERQHEREEHLDVLPCDWARVGEELRAQLGLPPAVGKPRFPTPEELGAWEEKMPGSVAWLRARARKEAEHRRDCARWPNGPRPRYLSDPK